MKHMEGYRCIKLYCYVFVLINFLRRMLSLILGNEHRDISNADRNLQGVHTHVLWFQSLNLKMRYKFFYIMAKFKFPNNPN